MARRLPPLNALLAFEAAARRGRMTEAANELCVTPGAVSRQVKRLEQSLGLSLFEGSKTRPMLTKAGQSLAPQLSLLFDHLHNAVQSITAQNSISLRLACYNTLAAKWLLPRISQLTQLHPDIDLQVNAVTHVDEALLQSHDAVLMARSEDDSGNRNFVCTKLFSETLGPVVSAGLYQQITTRKPSDILKLPTLHTQTRMDAWSTWLSYHDLQLPKEKQKAYSQPFQHYYFSLEAALRGRGVCVAPAHLVMDDLAAGRLVAPFGFIPSGLHYVLLTPLASSPAIKFFCQWLLKEASRVMQ